MTSRTDSHSPPANPPRSWRFLFGYGAAQAGAFICFIPLLTLLMPTRAEEIAGSDKALLLGQVGMIGGFAAAFANVLFGALSDRTVGRFGRRRPWIIGGLTAVGVTLGLIGIADSAAVLILAIVAFQFAINALYAPLTAIVPDMVLHRQKGRISALTSMALPIANVFTAVIVVTLSGSLAAQLLAILVAASVLILPFALGLREPVSHARPSRKRQISLTAFSDRRFTLAFMSRILVESGVAINTLFLLFVVQGASEAGLSGWSDLKMFSALLLIATLAATLGGLVAGPLSDRLGKRTPFVIAGSTGMAVGLGLLGFGSDGTTLMIAQALFGLSHGIHASTVAAMNAEILPDPAHAGRDLGLMNLAVALPQGLAPGIAVAVLSAGLPLSIVFALAAVSVFVATAVLSPLVRSV